MKPFLRILFAVCLLCTAGLSKAQLSYYKDSVRVSILDTNANPAGIANGIITTHSPVANSIFSNFNVVNAVQLYPSSSQQYLRQVYLIVCNCDESVLKDTLNSHSTMFWGAQLIPKPQELGITTPGSKAGFDFYPNPAAGHIHIQTSAAIEAVTITDLNGRTVWSQPTSDPDLATLAPGHYLLTVRTTAGSTSQVFVKN